jgi:hypothetical protein
MRILTCLFLAAAGLAVADQNPPAATPAPAQPSAAAKKLGTAGTRAVATPAGRGPATTPAKPAKPVVTQSLAVKTAQTTPRAPSKGPVPLAIPNGAHSVSPGLYRWTDPQGKVWMYRQTPFGVSRWPEDEDNSKLRVVAEETHATEVGDSIRFERPTPFGKQVWTRKKSDLDDTERMIWAHQQEKAAPANTAEKE